MYRLFEFTELGAVIYLYTVMLGAIKIKKFEIDRQEEISN